MFYPSVIKEPTQARFESFFKHNGSSSIVYPLWMMRQAGRYLPEYQALRQRFGSFMHLCSNPTVAAEITLQPLKRFELDAAIIFADILLPLLCFKGTQLHFDDRAGPHLESSEKDILGQEDYRDPKLQLTYVAEAIFKVKQQLHPYHHMIGFCGGPWTVALYALEGGNSQDHFQKAFSLITKHPVLFKKWLEVLTACSLEYLEMQIQAGSTQIMIFDSWAALCPSNEWYSYVYEPVLNLMKVLKDKYPAIPIIYYPKGKVEQVIIQKEQPFDVLACDHSVDLSVLLHKTEKALQGNFDPQILLSSHEVMQKNVEDKFSKLSRSVIVNLGQGIDPKTSPEQVSDFVKQIRYQERLSQQMQG